MESLTLLFVMMTFGLTLMGFLYVMGIIDVKKEVTPKRIVTARDIVNAKQDKNAVKKPIASWTAARRKLEQIDAPEQRQEQILKAHEEMN